MLSCNCASAKKVIIHGTCCSFWLRSSIVSKTCPVLQSLDSDTNSSSAHLFCREGGWKGIIWEIVLICGCRQNCKWLKVLQTVDTYLFCSKFCSFLDRRNQGSQPTYFKWVGEPKDWICWKFVYFFVVLTSVEAIASSIFFSNSSSALMSGDILSSTEPHQEHALRQ